jgi:hypothetical protein
MTTVHYIVLKHPVARLHQTTKIAARSKKEKNQHTKKHQTQDTCASKSNHDKK